MEDKILTYIKDISRFNYKTESRYVHEKDFEHLASTISLIFKDHTRGILCNNQD